jgi:two-component system response regulator GlrR
VEPPPTDLRVLLIDEGSHAALHREPLALSAGAALTRIRVAEALSTPLRFDEFDAVAVDALGVTLPRLVACIRSLANDPQIRPIVIVESLHGETARAAASAGGWEVMAREECSKRLDVALQRAARLRRLTSTVNGSAGGAAPTHGSGLSVAADAGPFTAQLLGRSPGMRQVLAQIRGVALFDIPVLIRGESGTGKERIAHAIHECSPRRGKPFVTVDCASIPEALIESHLFGHVRGAFTGAVDDRQGLCMAASGGTLFLDEVGELPLALQVKLLRFLDDFIVEPLGSRRHFRTDVRVLAATNRELAREVEQGSFRRDLFYRLDVFEILVPPLRDRDGDVLLLAEHFAGDEARRLGRPVPAFAQDAVDALLGARWPGNVRELANRVRRAVLSSPEGGWLSAEQLGFAAGAAGTASLREQRRASERDCLVQALDYARGNRSLAARALAISRSRFYDLLRRHGLDDASATARAAPQDE